MKGGDRRPSHRANSNLDSNDLSRQYRRDLNVSRRKSPRWGAFRSFVARDDVTVPAAVTAASVVASAHQSASVEVFAADLGLEHDVAESLLDAMDLRDVLGGDP